MPNGKNYAESINIQPKAEVKRNPKKQIPLKSEEK